MGKAYLPISKAPLEKKLQFKLPDGFIIKTEHLKEKPVQFDLYKDSGSPHIISILILDDTRLTMDDIFKDLTKHHKLLKFWSKTTFEDIQIFDCRNNTVGQTLIHQCNLSARWPSLNHNTFKDGEIAIFDKNNKSILIVTNASKMAYDPKVMTVLLENILGNK